MRIPAPDSPPRSRFDRLIVSNILEWGLQPERQGLPEFTPPAAGERFPAEEMALYWSGDRKLVVTRHPMDEMHVADLSAILGYENLICRASPAQQPGHSICTDLATDERALAQVIELLDDGPADGPVTVEAFGATPEYARLVASIRKRSKRAVIDLMTQDDYLEFARSLDSKLQAREYFQAALPQCAAMRLTRALTLRNGPDLLKHVQDALQVLGPVIVKTEFGAGGNAMAIIERTRSLRKTLTRILPAGYDGDLLVEEFLGSGKNALSVSYNGMVQDDGKTFTLSAGRHFLHADKFFLGSCLGVGSVPDDCAEKIRSAGEAIGQVAASFGYRGPLNADFIYRESDGVLFPLEINPRRALGATLADMCISLFGQGYEKAVSAVAHHSVPVHRTITTYAELRDCLLRQGLFGRETKGLVILPYMVTSLAAKSVIGLVVLGTDGTSAEAALGEITGYLARRHRAG
jgi:hypothetical protein